MCNTPEPFGSAQLHESHGELWAVLYCECGEGGPYRWTFDRP